MTVLSRNLFRQTIASLCMLTALLGSSVAWADESSDQSESHPALEKIQAFTNKASELVVQAMSMIGTHYRYGGNTPESGLDCSGLVRYVFKEAWGAQLPRTSVEISKVGTRVEPEELQPGDLVFYNTLRRGFSHVGIYLGDNKFIHAPSTGKQVRIESMGLSYWKKRFNGARRIVNPEDQAETAQLVQALKAEAAQAQKKP